MSPGLSVKVRRNEQLWQTLDIGNMLGCHLFGIKNSYPTHEKFTSSYTSPHLGVESIE